jgi:poly-gamma-glutamate capsule biosynthesis protein CapA/YwtB (metallophosphatase superfamily)
VSSPYPLRDNLFWLFRYLAPTLKNPTDLAGRPLEERLRDHAGPTTRLAFFGDLMCMQGDRIPIVDPAVRAILERAKIVVGNLESPLLFDASRSFARYIGHFAMSEEFLAGFLERLGAPRARTVLTIANNHMADQGEAGLHETIGRLEKLGIAALGRYADPRAAITQRDVDGLRFGFVGWSNWLNSKDRFKADPGIMRTEHVSTHDFRADKRALGIDVLIGSPHWEWEFHHFPRAESRALARGLIDRGFDLLIGHHPHVLQPIEPIASGLVAYSLGNLNGPALKRVGWPVRLGGILEVELAIDGDAKGQIVGYRLHPLAQLGAWDAERTIVRLEDAPDEERARLGERLAQVFQVAKQPSP